MDVSKVRARIGTLRGEFEDRLAALVEVPTVSMDPGRRGDIDRCAAVASEYLREAGARVDIVETGGFPMVVGRIDARSVVPHGDDLQPPRRAAGRPGRVAHASVHVHARRRSLARARRHRRQGAGADRALRRAAGAGGGRARQHPVPLGAGGGDRQPELRARPGRGDRGRRRGGTSPASRPIRWSCRTRSGSPPAGRRSPTACAG